MVTAVLAAATRGRHWCAAAAAPRCLWQRWWATAVTWWWRRSWRGRQGGTDVGRRRRHGGGGGVGGGSGGGRRWALVRSRRYAAAAATPQGIAEWAVVHPHRRRRHRHCPRHLCRARYCPCRRRGPPTSNREQGRIAVNATAEVADRGGPATRTVAGYRRGLWSSRRARRPGGAMPAEASRRLAAAAVARGRLGMTVFHRLFKRLGAGVALRSPADLAFCAGVARRAGCS